MVTVVVRNDYSGDNCCGCGDKIFGHKALTADYAKVMNGAINGDSGSCCWTGEVNDGE